MLRILFAFGLPILAATLWGRFRVPGDGSPPVIRVPGILRLLIEVIFFGFATWCLFDAGVIQTGWIFGRIIVIHYVPDVHRKSYSSLCRLVSTAGSVSYQGQV